MSVFFNAYMMIGCLHYFLLTSAFLPDLPLALWVPAHILYVGNIMCRLSGHVYIYVLNENPGFTALVAKTTCFFCG